jgi:hypothetical protein
MKLLDLVVWIFFLVLLSELTFKCIIGFGRFVKFCTKKIELFDSFVEDKTMHRLKTPPRMPMESDCHKRYYETNKCMPITSEFDEKSY